MSSDLDKTMEDVINSQPEVSNGVSNENSVSGYDSVDNYGRSFNSEIHLTDDDGKPQLTAKGKLRVKKGKSPSKIAKEGVKSQQPESYRQCAEVVCGTLFGFGQFIDAEAGKPTAQQAEFMVVSYERYFETKQIEDIPPGLAVFLSTAAYVAPLLIKTVRKKDSTINKFFKAMKDKLAKKRIKEPKTGE